MREGNTIHVVLDQSVVLMPPKKQTSWAMDELMEPSLNHVPLYEDPTDSDRSADNGDRVLAQVPT